MLWDDDRPVFRCILREQGKRFRGFTAAPKRMCIPRAGEKPLSAYGRALPVFRCKMWKEKILIPLTNSRDCYMIDITKDASEKRQGVRMMIVTIDFNSDEAIYIQLCNQIILGIATAQLHDGDSLPSVRDLAEDIGINMHTVNKAYSILRQEGYLKLDRRRGAVVALDYDKLQAIAKLKGQMRLILASAICRGISREEIHQAVDQIYDGF